MGLYNFQPRFAPFVLSGAKQHTIRAERAHPDKPGDICHLYTGLRTKRAKLLGRFPCVKVENISIITTADRDLVEAFAVAMQVPKHMIAGPMVFVDKVQLHFSECEALARKDGFDGFNEMMKFWSEPKSRLPFHGHIIHWRWHK